MCNLCLTKMQKYYTMYMKGRERIMYLFNKTEKANILSGRTITYVANKIGVTPTFLTSVFNGKRTCSKTVAYCIVKCLCQEAEIEDYFVKRGE